MWKTAGSSGKFSENDDNFVKGIKNSGVMFPEKRAMFIAERVAVYLQNKYLACKNRMEYKRPGAHLVLFDTRKSCGTDVRAECMSYPAVG